MAGSRLEKVGTVYTRVRDLMRSGVIKKSMKPLWFDVYTAFPPKRDPSYVKASKKVWGLKKEDPVSTILYKEDEIRAEFFKVYGSETIPFDLTNTSFVSTCQRFVTKYSELESMGDVKPQKLFEETGKALLSEGIFLRRRGGPAVAAAQQKDTTRAPEEHGQSGTTDSSAAS